MILANDFKCNLKIKSNFLEKILLEFSIIVQKYEMKNEAIRRLEKLYFEANEKKSQNN
jgi:hypothetical protein